MTAPSPDPALADRADRTRATPDPDPALVQQIRSALADADPGALAYLELGARLDRVSAVESVGGAVAWRSMHAAWDRPWIIGMGADPAAVAHCVEALAGRTGPPEGLTVARTAFVRLPDSLRPVEHWEWDWWVTRAAPARRPGEDLVVEIALDDPRIAELLGLASPEAMAWPGDRRIRRWAGIEARAVAGGDPRPPVAQDALVAVATVTAMGPGRAHLGSVATRPGWRGLGLARDLCARLTREELADGAPAVTLGMYAANRAARRVYSELGFEVVYRWASGRL